MVTPQFTFTKNTIGKISLSLLGLVKGLMIVGQSELSRINNVDINLVYAEIQTVDIGLVFKQSTYYGNYERIS